MNKLLHNNTLFTLTLLGIATALAFLFFLIRFWKYCKHRITLYYCPNLDCTIYERISARALFFCFLRNLYQFLLYLSVFPTEFHIERLSGHIYRNVDHYIAHHSNHFLSSVWWFHLISVTRLRSLPSLIIQTT